MPEDSTQEDSSPQVKGILGCRVKENLCGRCSTLAVPFHTQGLVQLAARHPPTVYPLHSARNAGRGHRHACWARARDHESLDLSRAPYVLYGFKYIGPASLARA